MQDEPMEQPARDGGGEDERLATLSGKIASVAAMLDRLEARLDSLHEDCQRAAGSGQRMLLRQQGLAESLARLEALLHGR